MLLISRQTQKKHRVLIVGAGEAARLLVKDIERTGAFDIVGVLDEDPDKLGVVVGGHFVIGTIDSLKQLIAYTGAAEVLIASPSTDTVTLAGILRDCGDAGVPARVLPAEMGDSAWRVGLRDLGETRLEDLLGRKSVRPENGGDLGGFFIGKRVLVTGAAGSIGSQLCRELAGYEVEQLVMVDNRETNLFEVHSEVSRMAPDRTEMAIADIRDRNRVRDVFARFSPQCVLHAAAYKHVNLMEAAPEEAVKTNVTGTRNLLEICGEFDVDHFTLISTDKAVDPTSIMGATKYLAELLTLGKARVGDTVFSAVRFGNVFGSAGSVAPVFHEQIRRGGPVTVTHPEATRFFISIAEAAYLVLQAQALGENGQLYVLDMGEPVQIDDLARKMITLCGYEPDEDIRIVYSGLRPGEKLHEELVTDEQTLVATESPHVLGLDCLPEVTPTILENIKALEDLAASPYRNALLATLSDLVPTLAVSRGDDESGLAKNCHRHAPKREAACWIENMPEGLVSTDEDRVLVALLRVGIDADKGAAVLGNLPSGLDWDVLLRQAARHGLIPLVAYHSVAAENLPVPAERLDQLKGFHVMCDIANEFSRRAVHGLARNFGDEGIDIMLLKGAVLSAFLYGDRPVRLMGDIDVMVRDQDVESAERVIRNMGYAPYRDSDFLRKLWQTSHHHLIPYRGPCEEVVEIHRDLLPLSDILGVSLDEVWRQASKIEIENHKVHSLCLEHMLLYLCTHSIFTDGKIQLRQVMDIGQLVRTVGGDMDWVQFERYLHQSPVRFAVSAMLRFVREITLAPVPEFLLGAEGAPIMSDRLLAAMRRRVFHEVEKPIPEPVAQFLFLEGRQKARLLRKAFSPHPLHQVDLATESYNRVTQGMRLAGEYASALLDIARMDRKTVLEGQGRGQ